MGIVLSVIRLGSYDGWRITRILFQQITPGRKQAYHGENENNNGQPLSASKHIS